MKNKKSFLLYTDLLEVVEQLPDEKAGEFFKHILRYVNDLEPQTDDALINLAFIPVKQGLKRDLEKYKNIVERNRKNGSKPKKTTGKTGNPNEAKKTDNDNDNDNDNDILLKKETKNFSFKASLIAYGFKKELVEDRLRVRNKKKSSNTITAFNGFIKELEKREISNLNNLLTHIIEKSWAGFKWEWIDNDKDKPKSNIERIGNMNDSLDDKIDKMFPNE